MEESSKETNELKASLEHETRVRHELETASADLRMQTNEQAEEIMLLKKSNNEKLQLLFEVKARWSEISHQWVQDQQTLTQKLKESQAEVYRLRGESSGAKEQFLICEEELGKAVSIAKDFKAKLEKEEKIKNDVLNENALLELISNL